MEKQQPLQLFQQFFRESKLDPTTINGGVINSIGNSAKLGKGNGAF